MNYLAHLFLAGEDEGLRLGAMLGDFVRGRRALRRYPPDAARGIRLHRHIDQYTDSLPESARLREHFPRPFRRYAGIVIDLAFDHELAKGWERYSPITLEAFDQEVRAMLARHEELVPPRLKRFMHYADSRGLFAAYRKPSEILYSLRGIGTRLSRPNPLHRVSEIWPGLEPRLAVGFEKIFPQVRLEVANWLRSNPAVRYG